MLSAIRRDNFGDNGHDFCAHETDSELQLLRCLFPKLQFLSDPACQRSSDSGPACLQDLAWYAWWGSAFGVGGRGLRPIESMGSWILEESDERCRDRLVFFVAEFCSLWNRGPTFG